MAAKAPGDPQQPSVRVLRPLASRHRNEGAYERFLCQFLHLGGRIQLRTEVSLHQPRSVAPQTVNLGLAPWLGLPALGFGCARHRGHFIAVRYGSDPGATTGHT
jgi:hypothetical protein